MARVRPRTSSSGPCRSTAFTRRPASTRASRSKCATRTSRAARWRNNARSARVYPYPGRGPRELRQRLRRGREHTGMEGMRMRDDVHIRPIPEHLRMDRPFGMTATRTGDLVAVPVDQYKVLRPHDLAKSDTV